MGRLPAPNVCKGKKQEACTSPVIKSAHGIRCAKILILAARLLGEETGEWEKDIQSLSQALQNHAWNPESGYFSYVCHDEKGNPSHIVRHEESGQNYNQGFDGVYPLIAGICDGDQEKIFLEKFFSPRHLWSPIGLIAVDQSAPYYRCDGYWNGSVWMAHQWFFWKTMLDLGMGDKAFLIAKTALDVWKTEVEESYNCMEHFIVASGQGAGWHQFGGLSSPLLNWYAAYYLPGRINIGLDGTVEDHIFSPDYKNLKARLSFITPLEKSAMVIITLAPGHSYQARWNGEEIPCRERVPGA